jgi:large conductance mechanosensitive channel
MKVLQEFREFAIKGNMIDMAVGIIIGAASSKVVSSLVDDILMPPLGYFIGKVNFSDLEAVIMQGSTNEQGQVVPEIVIGYGSFIQVTIDFLLMALVLFLVVKVYNTLRRMGDNENEKSVPTPRDIELLAKINDTLVRVEKGLGSRGADATNNNPEL